MYSVPLSIHFPVSASSGEHGRLLQGCELAIEVGFLRRFVGLEFDLHRGIQLGERLHDALDSLDAWVLIIAFDLKPFEAHLTVRFDSKFASPILRFFREAGITGSTRSRRPTRQV